MAYDKTGVPIVRTQDGIRRLIMSHRGFGIAFVSERVPGLPPQEGFSAKVLIKDALGVEKPYCVRIVAKLRDPPGVMSDRQRGEWHNQEERRVWRVLFYHLKSVFEAADTGVMEFKELMLPYLVLENNQTIAEAILPKLDAVLAGQPDLNGRPYRLLQP